MSAAETRKAITIRLAPSAHKLVALEAAEKGVSLSAFMAYAAQRVALSEARDRRAAFLAVKRADASLTAD